MDLTIIIVNWNTRDLLQNCLRSVAERANGRAVQTIVVDNNSADGSGEMVARCFPQVLLINSGGNVGFARANNLGLTKAEAPLILFLNPDTEVTGAALAQMIEFMEAHEPVGALGCKIRNRSGSIQELGLQWFPNPVTELLKFLAVSDWSCRRLPRWFPYHDPEVSGEVTKLFGACLLVRRSVLDQVGAFDERFFMYCEDVDLCYRIVKAGWRLFYLSEAEILHLGGSASAQATSAFSALMMCESFSKFMHKHYGTLGAALYRAGAFLGAQARLLVLFGWQLANCLRCHGAPVALRASIYKYLTITKWCLGLQKPVVRN